MDYGMKAKCGIWIIGTIITIIGIIVLVREGL